MTCSGSPTSSPSLIRASSPRVNVTATAVRLAFRAGANLIELAGRAQLLVFARNKIRVGLHENFAWRPEIELLGMVAEKFAMNTGPYQAPIGVDVHLGHTQLGGREIFVFV